MSLDYTKGCVNFRDVGEWLNLMAGKRLLPAGRILRGGKLDFVTSSADIGSPGTIINLRKGPDPESKHFNADYHHFPISNDHEKYETQTPEVRRWLQDIFQCLAADIIRYPVLFHCTSGKDRTGVVVAVLLLTLGIDHDLIIQEYLLSDGDVHRDWICMALDGVGVPNNYFRRVDLERVRNNVLARHL